MGIFCSFPKLLTPQHESIKHTGLHNEENCRGKHCGLRVQCNGNSGMGYCIARYTVCLDCMKINGREEITCPTCWNKVRIRGLLQNYYNKEERDWLRDHHNCNDYMKTEWVGRKYWMDMGQESGEQFTRCHLCFKSRCYRCEGTGGSPSCHRCDAYYKPRRICQYCHHNHKAGKECNHETVTTGNINNPNYCLQNGFLYEVGGSSSVNLKTQCGCLM